MKRATVLPRKTLFAITHYEQHYATLFRLCNLSLVLFCKANCVYPRFTLAI